MEIELAWPITVNFHIHRCQAIGQTQRVIKMEISEESTIKECVEVLEEFQKILYNPRQALVKIQGQPLQHWDQVGEVFDRMGSQKVSIDLFYKSNPDVKRVERLVEIYVEFKDPDFEKEFVISTSSHHTFDDVMYFIKEQVVTDPYFQHWTSQYQYSLCINQQCLAEFPQRPFQQLTDQHGVLRCTISRL